MSWKHLTHFTELGPSAAPSYRYSYLIAHFQENSACCGTHCTVCAMCASTTTQLWA